MNITECPHCHRRVISSSSGDCPSCGKNVAEVSSAGNQMRLLIIRGSEAFLNICFNCAGVANRWVKLKISNVDVATSLRRSLLRHLVPLGGLFTAFSAAKNDRSFTLKLPVCDACRKQKIKPEVQSYDFESGEIRIVVHEQFRESVNSIKP